MKDQILLKINLIVKKLKEPVLTYEEIMTMDFSIFNRLLQIFNKKYELDFLG